LDGIEHIVEMDIESVRHGSAFLMHVILDHVVDKKFRLMMESGLLKN
jgi:hypothetical protein